MRNWTAPKSIAQFVSWEAFQIWVLPLFSVPVTVVIGWLSDLPWFYIWLGVGFMFAMATTGLLRFDEWRTRTTAKNKLVFSSLRIKKVLSGDGSVSAVSIGFQLRNMATFPMQFSVQKMRTKLMNAFPPKEDYENDTINVSANSNGWFDDHLIRLANVATKGKLAEGTIYVYLKYGRPGRLDHTLELNKKVLLKFDDQGDVQAVEWYDL